MVHHRPDLPVLQHRVPRNLAEVHHAWGQRRHGLGVCDRFPGPRPARLEGVAGSNLRERTFGITATTAVIMEPFLCARPSAQHLARVNSADPCETGILVCILQMGRLRLRDGVCGRALGHQVCPRQGWGPRPFHCNIPLINLYDALGFLNTPDFCSP